MKITLRTFSFWTNFLVSTAVLVGILVIVNLVSYRYYYIRDLTEEKVYSLSEQTKNILKELEKKVKEEGKEFKVLAFMREDSPETKKFQDIMQIYKYESPAFKWEIVDPEKKPQIAANYDIRELGTFVFQLGERKLKVSLDFDDPTKTPESEITNSILKLVRVDEPQVCFVEGHGEKDPNDTGQLGLSELALALKDEGFRTIKIRAWEEGALQQCNVLFVAGPVVGFSDAEIKAISEYLLLGGRAVFLSDPDSKDNIQSILEPWGIGLDNVIIVDPNSRALGVSPAMPIVIQYDETHPITRGFKIGVITRLTRRVFIKGRVQGIDATEIARTSESSWAENDWASGTVSFEMGKDIRGPVPVAVAVSGIPGTAGGEVVYGTMQNPATTQARIVVIGDSDLVANGFISLLGNKNFILNVVNWVAERGELIAIRPKERKRRTLVLTPSQIGTIRNIFLFGIPIFFIALSALTYLRKRRL
ncbi:MAG: GldG family protein [Candidatus Calescibacterium sp.]|nr:GldG family protein [Candidatus Calescibacterium sp.]MDW8086488.1 Gldg family protein [Candidatus Calescibacterium sp.]